MHESAQSRGGRTEVMKGARTGLGIGIALMLAACGGGNPGPSISEGPDLPLQIPRQAHHAPRVDLHGRVQIGADVAASPSLLAPGPDHGEIRVAYGMVRDGVGAQQLTAYLQADAAAFQDAGEDTTDVQLLPDGLILRFGRTPPTIRLAAGTSPAFIDETLRVVQAINAALPRDWQLKVAAEAALAGASRPPDGEILVTFAPQAEWPDEAPIDEAIGLAESRYTLVPTTDPDVPLSIESIAGRVWVDPSLTAGQERLGVIAHEIIHVLGRNHVDAGRFPKTLMVAGGSEEVPADILHPLDREALLAVYAHLEPGVAPAKLAEALGPWADTSLHVRGELDIPGGDIAFGTALRNGLSQPWAVGPTPQTDLADNIALSGSVSWRGRLLGLTPHAETVSGGANLTLELATLTGTMDFAELEQWGENTAPGMVGTGTMWRDGDLSYRIEVQGNVFIRTGGDVGTVTGAFFGPAHEGMGGVLQRDDLSAGFGGKR